jgi:hypothetical protein
MICPLLVHCLIRGPALGDWAPQLHNGWTVVKKILATLLFEC